MTVRDLIRRRLGAAAVLSLGAAVTAAAQDPPPLLEPPPLIPASATEPVEKKAEAKKEEPKKDEAKPAAPVVPPPLMPSAAPVLPPPLVPPAADAKPAAPVLPPPTVKPADPKPPAVPAPTAGGLPPLVLPPIGEPAKPAEVQKDEPKPVAVPKPVDVSPVVPAVPVAPTITPPKIETPPPVKADIVLPAPVIVPSAVVAPPAKPDMVVPKLDMPATPVVPASRPANVAPVTPIAPATKPVEAVTASRMRPADEVKPARPMSEPPPRSTVPSAPPPATPNGIGRPTGRSVDGLAAFHLMIAEAKVAYSKVKDYSGHLIRQDRVRGVLQPEQTAEVRAKTQPNSLHLRWIAPSATVGREAAFISGKNAGRVRLKPAGAYGVSAWTSVEPADPKGMAEGRQPLTQVGVGPIVARLERLARIEAQLRNPVFVAVGEYTYAGKPVIRYEAVMDQPHALREAYRVVVYIDPETKLPVRWETYDQPLPGGDPAGELLECCSFVNLKFNQGLPDSLFNR